MQTATATDLQVIQALGASAGSRDVSFTYLLMNSSNTVIGDVTDYVISSSLDMNSLADINRTAKFVIVDDGTINFIIDRIQPWCAFVGADTPAWPLGVFLLSSGAKYTNEVGTVLRDVDGYDGGLVLLQDNDGGSLGTAGQRYTVPAGVRYTTAIKALLDAYRTAGVPTNNVSTLSTAVLLTAKDWDPGTSTAKILGDLLSAINYYGLYFDDNGTAMAVPYTAPADRASGYNYAADRTSIMFEDANRKLDLFDIPNKWVRVVSDPDRPPLVGTYTNSNPASSTSTVARGRTIADFATGADAPDQTTLNAQVLALAVEASQTYEKFEFDTAINPLHSFSDVYTITFPDLGISALKFSETKWSMELKAGARMKHSARRVVSL